MLNSVPVALIIGTVLGFLSGLGIGGGSLLMIWLTVILGMDPAVARSINLLFFIPSALISSIIRINQKSLLIKPLLPAIIAGCTSAAAFTWISAVIEIAVLRKLFGCILLFAGIREIFYRKNEEKGSSD